MMTGNYWIGSKLRQSLPNNHINDASNKVCQMLGAHIYSYTFVINSLTNTSKFAHDFSMDCYCIFSNFSFSRSRVFLHTRF